MRLPEGALYDVLREDSRDLAGGGVVVQRRFVDSVQGCKGHHNATGQHDADSDRRDCACRPERRQDREQQRDDTGGDEEGKEGRDAQTEAARYLLAPSRERRAMGVKSSAWW